MSNGFRIVLAMIVIFLAGALWATFSGYRKVDSFTSLDKYGSQLKKEFPEVKHISTRSLAGLIEAHDRSGESLLLIDCRRPDEYAISHLPGSVNLESANAVKDFIAKHPAPKRPIVVYCSVGYRSAQLAEELEKTGVSGVENVVGSIFKWANEGRPIVDSEGKPAAKVHPFNQFWSRHLSDGLASD